RTSPAAPGVTRPAAGTWQQTRLLHSAGVLLDKEAPPIVGALLFKKFWVYRRFIPGIRDEPLFA
ncbi:MAG: hypothetical protein ACJ8LG_16975, partial [Massilia sp.]